MRTVSFQGAQLSANERRRLHQQQQVKAFINPVIQQHVSIALERLDTLRLDPQDDPYRYRLDYQAKGTPFLGDAFGF